MSDYWVCGLCLERRPKAQSENIQEGDRHRKCFGFGHWFDQDELIRRNAARKPAWLRRKLPLEKWGVPDALSAGSAHLGHSVDDQ